MRVLCAMSGGVDSSVAAYLLKEAGHDVVGAFMWMCEKNRPLDTGSKRCCSIEDARDVQEVGESLGIEVEILDFSKEFAGVIDYFVSEYSSGRTPNPCAVCNRDIKFGTLFEHAEKVGCEAIATGHFTRVFKKDQRHFVRRGADPDKDQSYFLFLLSQEQLGRAVFPCGDMTKAEVRGIAGEIDLLVADKDASQEVCFVDAASPGDFILARAPEKITPGPLMDTSGQVVGEHRGLQYYTIGQRRGLGVAMGSPRYVVKIDVAANTVVIGEEDDLFASRATADCVVWSLDNENLEFPQQGEAMIRYNMKPRACTFAPVGNGSIEVIFNEPVRGVTPGQALVVYQDDLVVCGGWIQ